MSRYVRNAPGNELWCLYFICEVSNFVLSPVFADTSALFEQGLDYVELLRDLHF